MEKATVHLTPDQVPSFLRCGYNGKMFKANVVEQLTIPSDAGLWDSGSRETYTIVRLADGSEFKPTFQKEAPWGARIDVPVNLEPGIAVIMHSIFCGKDMGLTFYVHPQDATKMLPAPAADLSDLEKIVLNATACLKSSYAGKDRYQMTCENLRYGPNRTGAPIPTRAQWDEAKASLIGRGFLNKAGAITVAGRNAR